MSIDTIFDGEDLFMDETTNESTDETPATEPSTEETQEAESTTEAPSSETTEQPFLTIQYNKESKGLTQEEATTLAQKGMNYDKVYQELQDYKSGKNADPALNELDYWAKQNNMTRQEYVSFLRENRHTQMLQTELNDIKTKYPDMPDEAAREMAEMRCKGREEENARLETEQAQQQRDAELAPWQKFIEVYGITDASQIPAEVLADINAGASPVEAMQAYEIAELKKQLEAANASKQIAEKNKKNKEAAMPSAATQAQTEAEDSFLSGMGL